MRLYLPIVGQSVEDTLDDTLAYIIVNGYAEYAAAFLEDYAQTLRRLQRIAGALPLHRIPMLAERGYREIRFSNHEWYFLYVLEGDTAQVRILANDKQDIEALARRDS